MELVGEVRSKVEQIFNVGNREASLQQLLTACREGKRCVDPSVNPIFIPLSAGNAFAFRMAASRPYEEFRKLDLKLIDKIGRDEVGKTKWKKLALDKKYEIAYGVMSDAAQYQEHLETTNFDKLLLALSYSIGGNDVQHNLIDLQIEVSLRKLTGESPIVEHLRAVYDRCIAIDRDPARLKVAFWESFGQSSTTAYSRVMSDLDATALAASFDELIAYRDFACQVGWHDEEGKTVDQIVGFVGQQVTFVLERESEWSIGGAAIARDSSSFPWHWKPDAKGWRNIYTFNRIASAENPGAIALTWKSLTYHDWTTIIGSLLLMASNRHFCERFGRDKMLLERLLQRHTFYLNCFTNEETTTEEQNAFVNIKEFSEGKFVNGKFIPKDPVKYSVVAQVAAPELISDPSHWGHVIWKFGMFMDKLETTKA
jgi:hypothetical protein